jgi:hypothetical protein
MPSEAAEKLILAAKRDPQAVKRRSIFNDLTARVNLRPSRFLSQLAFFRSLFRRAAKGVEVAPALAAAHDRPLPRDKALQNRGVWRHL